MYRPYKGRIPETLLDGLSEISENEIIAVGSDTAYMYIGTVGGFFPDLPIIEKFYSTRKAAPYKPNKPFIPLLSRTVKDVFYRNTPGEPEITVFIVKGYEIGKIWLLSEYEKSFKEMKSTLEKEKKEKKKCT